VLWSTLGGRSTGIGERVSAIYRAAEGLVSYMRSHDSRWLNAVQIYGLCNYGRTTESRAQQSSYTSNKWRPDSTQLRSVSCMPGAVWRQSAAPRFTCIASIVTRSSSVTARPSAVYRRSSSTLCTDMSRRFTCIVVVVVADVDVGSRGVVATTGSNDRHRSTWTQFFTPDQSFCTLVVITSC